MTTFDDWSRGYGVIEHSPQTRERISVLANQLVQADRGARRRVKFSRRSWLLIGLPALPCGSWSI